VLSPTLWTIVILLLGLIFGSFFNVAIHRWPKEDRKEREWVHTPSRCPSCGARIAWFDNIPLLSWLLLRGKCRSCKAPIHWRYPVVEASTAILWLGTAWLVRNIGLSGVGSAELTGWHYFFAILLASLCFLTVIIDGQTQIIPHEINVPLFTGAWAFFLICQPATISSGWLDSVIGMLVLALPFGVFYLLNWMGDADIPFVASMGVLLGWKLTLTAGLIAVALGGLVGLALLVRKIAKEKAYKPGTEIPFGPFLAVSTYITMFWGQQILDWYLGLIIRKPPGSLAGILPFWLT